MKKLMFFVTSLKTGGSEKACVRTANALSDRYDVTICTLFGGGELERELLPSVRVKNAFPHFVRGVARVSLMLPSKLCRRLFIRGEYDAEIAVGDGLESHIVSGGKNPEKFSWVHMDVRYHGSAPSEKTRKRYGAFKKIICVSETAKKAFAEKYGFAEKTAVSYPPVDFDNIENLSRAECDTVPFGGDYYITVGRLEKVKGFDRLLKAVSAADGANLVIVGGGSCEQELSALCKDLGVSGRVHFTGQLQNPYPLVKKAKAYVCSSLNESFGFAPLEAMFLGVPVISVRCGGPEEIINCENIGYLCENSVEGLTEALEKNGNGSIKTDLAAAKKRALDFSPKACLDEFIAILGI